MSTFQSDNVDELTVVHELAHQWFGNAVTVAQWRDLWLAEGFATYFELLWQHRGDRPGLEAGIRGPARLRGREGVGPAVVSRPQDLFAFNTYYRGALTLHALRLDVGDRKFARIAPRLLSHLPQRQRDLGRLHRRRCTANRRGGVRAAPARLAVRAAGAAPAGRRGTARQAGAATPPALGVGVRRH